LSPEIGKVERTSPENIDFSVVIPAIGSEAKLARLQEVIEAANRLDRVQEIILVWQGEALSPFLRDLPPKVRVVLCETRATSYARNRGAEFSNSEYLVFLDDDTIPLGNYSEVASRYLRQGNDFVYANVLTFGVKRSRASQSITTSIAITRQTAIGNAWEPGLTISRHNFLKVRYNESLGPGCIHGSSEGLDFAIRLLDSKLSGIRAHDLVLDHPEIPFDLNYPNKVAFYSFGNGYVAVKNRLLGHYSYDLSKALARIMINILVWNRYEIRVWAIRFLALLIGPILKSQPPLTLSSKPVRELSTTSRSPELVRDEH